jgi:hypothetical protein
METIESFFTPRDQHFGAYLIMHSYIGGLWRGGTLKSGLFVALLIGALGLALPLRAAEFICASRDVACLINAINQANANGEANRITLRRGTYTLTVVDNGTGTNTNGLPVITSPLTIRGQGAETTVIERDTGAPGFRILSVAAAGTLTLERLTLRGGLALVGGGILTDGTVTIAQSTITGNRANFGGGGVMIREGTVTLIATTVTRNGSIDGPGGILIGGGDPPLLIIADSSIDHNGGGGTGPAGGIRNVRGTLVITNTTIAANTNSSRPFPFGAGIANEDGIVLLTNSTLAENTAIDSVGFFGIGGGIGNRGSGVVLIQNTIIARNSAGMTGQDCSGTVTSLGNNLIGDLSGCAITLQPSDLTGDPGLDTFTDNGKPGNGHFPLLSTSQAIDAGNNAVCLRRDQLGKRRVGPCDIGAIAFRDKDDRRHEEEDDQQHEEDLVGAVKGSR